MAATAVYVNIVTIPIGSGTNGESKKFSNIAATTSPFKLKGGKYGVSCKASTYGTVTLKILGPDDTTYLTALTAFSADGYATVDLPDAFYEVVVA